MADETIELTLEEQDELCITKTVNTTQKARYWTFILYPESMIDDWESKVSMLMEYPIAYCKHDKDIYVDDNGEVHQRKEHVHFLLCCNNTTTYNHVLKIAQRLGKCNVVKSVLNVSNMYNLIHDTEDSKKHKKYQYAKEERIELNGFDIGSYIQLSTSEKMAITKELIALACTGQFTNFYDYTQYILTTYEDDAYFNEFISHQSLLNNIIRGNYHKLETIERMNRNTSTPTPMEALQVRENEE